MANIEQDLQAIANARKGRDVRNSIHDAIRDINIESSHAEEVAVSAQDSAYNSANRSESYAVGGTGTREGEDTDNSKYFYEQTAILAQGFEVYDTLESTSPYHPLSAKQGNVLDGKISTINGKVGNANGIASLDSTGRIPYSQLPESAMEYKGTWNASTNTPTLTSGVGENGDFYVVSVAGTWNNENWAVGDRALFDGITENDWVRLPAGEVQSVNGKVGAVQLDAGDIPFDKETSPLVSTNTNDAILEVLQKAGVQVISTTMADYLAHKVDYDRSGAIINITDTGVANSAGNVSYDNTVSELLSTTTQGAIDEVKGITDDIIDDIGDIEDDITDLTPTAFTTNESNHYFDFQYAKIGNMVILSILPVVSTTFYEYTATIPEAYRPTATVFSDVLKGTLVEIGRSGGVYVYFGNASGTNPANVGAMTIMYNLA